MTGPGQVLISPISPVSRGSLEQGGLIRSCSGVGCLRQCSGTWGITGLNWPQLSPFTLN